MPGIRSPFRITRHTPRSRIENTGKGKGWQVRWKGDLLPEDYTEADARAKLTSLHDNFLNKGIAPA